MRDQLRVDSTELVCQPFRWAIFDEVDLILIGEARIPLVIAGGDSTPADLACRCTAIVRVLQPDWDYPTKESCS